ncbi:hypothetical protein [Ornithinibacillus sp. JPR2-1]|uniref:hypothetical protein n=1 Tax=Ornithinibacillus sp. JPR2-1 TaxID=2094019 RepID=UPI0031D18C19
MKSGWIINFKNGTRVILSERAYKRYVKETPKQDVQSDEHWFDIEKARSKNPDLDYIE